MSSFSPGSRLGAAGTSPSPPAASGNAVESAFTALPPPQLPRPGPPLHSSQATCELAAFPSQQKRIFVSSIFLLKLEVTTLSFPKHSPLCCTRSRARLCFDSIHMSFLLSHPSREKLTILTKHALVFPVFHAASLSQLESQTPSPTSPHNVLSLGTCRDKSGRAEVWEPDMRGPPSSDSTRPHPPANTGSAVGSKTLQNIILWTLPFKQFFGF